MISHFFGGDSSPFSHFFSPFSFYSSHTFSKLTSSDIFLFLLSSFETFVGVGLLAEALVLALASSDFLPPG